MTDTLDKSQAIGKTVQEYIDERPTWPDGTMLPTTPMTAMQFRIWALACAGKFFEGMVVFMTGVALPLISIEFHLTAANKGVDVEFDSEGKSYIEVRDPRMYYLVQNSEFGSHTLELFPTRSGYTLNSFTFGNNCQTQFEHS